MDSPAGRALAAGSTELAELPGWSGPRVYAMGSDHFDAGLDDDLVGDVIVYPASATAGTTAPGMLTRAGLATAGI